MAHLILALVLCAAIRPQDPRRRKQSTRIAGPRPPHGGSSRAPGRLPEVPARFLARPPSVTISLRLITSEGTRHVIHAP
jgi:hypothetical protein